MENNSYAHLSFKEDTKSFEGGGGEFAVEGTYSVKNGELTLQGTTVDPDPGKKYNDTYTIVEITDKAPMKFTIKNAKGEIAIYELQQSYGD